MKTFLIKIPKDLRLGQVIFDFLAWLRIYEDVAQDEDSRMADPFYLSDERIIDLWHKYTNHAHQRKQEQAEE